MLGKVPDTRLCEQKVKIRSKLARMTLKTLTTMLLNTDKIDDSVFGTLELPLVSL